MRRSSSMRDDCDGEASDVVRLRAISSLIDRVGRELDLRRAMLRHGHVEDVRRLHAELGELEDDWCCLASAREHALGKLDRTARQ